MSDLVILVGVFGQSLLRLVCFCCCIFERADKQTLQKVRLQRAQVWSGGGERGSGKCECRDGGCHSTRWKMLALGWKV